MAQPVTAILSRQEALASRARRFTKDANEAGVLVGHVMSRALGSLRGDEPDQVINEAMQRDLDRMIERLRSLRR